MRTFVLTILCFVPDLAAADAKIASTALPRTIATLSTEKKASEHFYDSILIKFDKNCVENLSLTDYYKQALMPKSTDGHSFASVLGQGASPAARSGNMSSIELDPDKFAKLLSDRLLRTRSSIVIKHSGDDTRDANILRDARRRKLKSVPYEERLARSSLRRKLSELNHVDREEEILASLHLLAASRLVGSDKAAALLDFEEKGDTKQFNDLVSSSDQVGVQSNNTNKITEFETLDFLEMHVVSNKVLKETLFPLTKILPCLLTEPEPDSTKDSLSATEPANLRSSDVTSPAVYSVDLSRTSPTDKKLQSVTSGVQTVFVPPNDPHFHSQWYMKGAAQGEKFGSHVIDGWSSLVRTLESADENKNATTKQSYSFESLLKLAKGMTVAVLDSGCSRNPDLLNQFWRNPDTPGCGKDAFVGTATSNGDSNAVVNDCVGYDFGNNQPDPTLEIATRIHGSSTAGLMVAEGHNDIGIVGVCPYCKLVCLKIYDSERERITMTSVVRALDYIGRKNIKLSNHSYGGFGASEIERSAHEALTRLGHLAVCSSGNNACNIDAGAAIANGDNNPPSLSDPNVCRNSNGMLLGPFTPATYDVSGILSVGGTTRTGELAWFSNYGANSVDVFAPGDDVVTLYGSDQLASVKGTSFSAPLAAGMAAVLWSANPSLTNLQVKQVLMSTGMMVDKLQGKAREGRIVSLSRALASDTSSYMLTAGSEARFAAPLVAGAVLSYLAC